MRGVTAFVRLGGLAFTERAEGLAALAVGVVGAIEIGAARAVGLGVVGREARAGGRHPPAVVPGGVGGRTLQPVGASEALRQISLSAMPNRTNVRITIEMRFDTV